MDASERKSVDLGLKQNIRDDASTLLRESLYDALTSLFQQFENLFR